MTANTFARCLMDMRGIARMSQWRLAELAEYNHSYISRLELGQRLPSRDAVLRLAEAMQLSADNRDRLLLAAGYMPLDVRNLIDSEPVIGELVALLEDRMVTDEVRDDVRTAIAVVIRQARRAPQARIEVLA